MADRPPSDLDDLSTYDDDLVRALCAPGTGAELADEDRYVAAFRAGRGSSVATLPRRALGRFSAGGTAVVVTVALTSGVAAAYTGHLPDPVQQIAHHVLGAPAPGIQVRPQGDASGPHRTVGSPPAGPTPPVSPSSGSSTSPADPQTPAGPATSTGHSTSPVQAPSAAPSGHHGTDGPSSGPSGSPSPATSGGAASSVTMSAPAHRVDVGQTLTLTGQVTDAAGAALAGQPVVLQERGPWHWRPLVRTATDAAGVATAVTPAVTRSIRLRWHAARHVNSVPWLLRMVPTVSVTADVGGTTTSIDPTALGAAPGDRIRIVRHLGGRTQLVRRARLDATGSAQVPVRTPHRRARYVVRLLPTRRHTAARGSVVVVPPQPAMLAISASAGRVVSGGTATISGTVTSENGIPLPGHRVVLLRRGPARWRAVGHARTDAAGQVSITTPAITATTRFRLRTDHRVRSAVRRIVEVPSLSASAQPAGSKVSITATATGARTGDRVVLLRRAGGRLVRLRHNPLRADGSVTFVVPERRTRTTYVVRLVGTKRHGPASASVTVPRAAG